MGSTLNFGRQSILGPYGLVDEGETRAAATALADYLVNGEAGAWDDAKFDFVVERRQSPGYSGCGDLCHAVLWAMLGAKPPEDEAGRQAQARVVNRAEAYGWKVGVNISRLRYSTGDAFIVHKPHQPWAPKGGDLVLVGEDGREHVFVVTGWDGDMNGGELRSCDYGQFNEKLGKHGGCRVVRRPLRGQDGRLWTKANGRPVVGHVDLVKLLQTLADASGAGTELPNARVAPGSAQG
jgi:hypothetical protein